MRILDRMYAAFIRPIFQWLDVVWDDSTNCNRLEKRQIEAALIVKGQTRSVSRDNLYVDDRCASLRQRRKGHELLPFHNFVN